MLDEININLPVAIDDFPCLNAYTFDDDLMLILEWSISSYLSIWMKLS